MISPQKPDNEKERQAAVEKYQLLDTLSEEQYDDITKLVAGICDVPICLITLLDKERNFLKSHFGVPFNESPREISFCGHTILSDDPITIIKDAREDHRFFDNPLVDEHKAIFYAGVPLVDSEGYKLGTLCVYDHQPRNLTSQQLEILFILAKQVIKLFEQHYQNQKLLQFQEVLKKRNEDLEKFARIVSHDLKSPLANIISLTELLQNDHNNESLNEESKLYIEYLKTSSYSLKDYIDGLLKFYKSDDFLKQKKETIKIPELFEEIRNITDTSHVTHFKYSNNIKHLRTYKLALMQVLINLITNSIKYNSKPEIYIDIEASENEDFYIFSVKDNGDGIPKTYQEKIFDLFSVVGITDRDGNLGSGIGLATVKKIITTLGGKITLDSKETVGSTFTFQIAKVVSDPIIN